MAETYRNITALDTIPDGQAAAGTLTAAAGSNLITLAGTTQAVAQKLLETGGDISGTDYDIGDNLWIYVPSLSEVRKFKAVSDYTTTGAYFYVESAFGGALAGVAWQVVNGNLREYNIDNKDNATAATIGGAANFLEAEKRIVVTAQDVISPKLLDPIVVNPNGGAGLAVMEQTR